MYVEEELTNFVVRIHFFMEIFGTEIMCTARRDSCTICELQLKF